MQTFRVKMLSTQKVFLPLKGSEKSHKMKTLTRYNWTIQVPF